MNEGTSWRLLMGLEGPVVDPAPGLVCALRCALTDVGRPPARDADLAWTLDVDFDQALERLLGSESSRLATAVTERFHAHYARHGRAEGRIHEAMTRVLATFARRPDIETVLVSGETKSDLQRHLAHLGLATTFDAVACTTHRACAQCRRSLAVRVAEGNGTQLHRTLWLSDDPDDLASAARRGIRCVAALWGRSPAAELKPARPDFWAESPEDLAALLSMADGRRLH